MLAYNDKSCTFKAYLKMSKYIKVEHMDTTMKCLVFQKMNIELKYNFS